MSIESTSPSEQALGLRPNAIGLPGVLFQSITTMAPAGAVAFSFHLSMGTDGWIVDSLIFAAIAFSLAYRRLSKSRPKPFSPITKKSARAMFVG